MSRARPLEERKFGFHRGSGEHEPGRAAAYVQIYVKSSALSRTPDLAISAHLTTEAEIDEFMDAPAELEEIRIDTKKVLAAATSTLSYLSKTLSYLSKVCSLRRLLVAIADETRTLAMGQKLHAHRTLASSQQNRA